MKNIKNRTKQRIENVVFAIAHKTKEMTIKQVGRRSDAEIIIKTICYKEFKNSQKTP